MEVPATAPPALGAMITAYMGNNAAAHKYVFQKDVNENRMIRGDAATNGIMMCLI